MFTAPLLMKANGNSINIHSWGANGANHGALFDNKMEKTDTPYKIDELQNHAK